MKRNKNGINIDTSSNCILPKIVHNSSNKQNKHATSFMVDNESDNKTDRGKMQKLTDRQILNDKNLKSFRLQKLIKLQSNHKKLQQNHTHSSNHRQKIKLCSVKLKKLHNKQFTQNQSIQKQINDDEEQKKQLQQLEEWATTLKTNHKKTLQIFSKQKNKKRRISESIAYLYKNQNRYTHRIPTFDNFKYISQKYKEIGLFIASIDSYINKLHSINYEAIHKNIQYTQGVYSGEVNILLKKIESYRQYIRLKITQKFKDIQKSRGQHNQLIEQLNQNRVADYNVHQQFSYTNKKIQQQKQNQKQQIVIDTQTEIVNNKKINNNQFQYVKSINSSRSSSHSAMNQLKNGILSCQNPAIVQQQIRTSIDTQENSIQNSQPSKQSFTMKSHKSLKNANIIQKLKQISNKIDELQQNLKPLKDILNQINNIKIKVLKTLLKTGYDTRQDGLAWVLRQLHKQSNMCDRGSFDEECFETSQKQLESLKGQFQVKAEEFPPYLNNQQISFIMSKFNNNFIKNPQNTHNRTANLKNSGQISDVTLQDHKKQDFSIIQQAYRNIRKMKNRKLSVIEENQILKKLLNEQKLKKCENHKYLTKDIIQLMEGTQKIKATKYQIIYSETLRKLNRICSQQIYTNKKQNKKQQKVSQKNIGIINTILDDLKKMMTNSHIEQQHQSQFRTQQQRKLSQILKKIRNQRYQSAYSHNNKSKSPQVYQQRNHIQVICCLVGSKRAAKIIQNQMNINIASTI